MKKKRITININKNDYDYIVNYLKDKETNTTELIRNIIQDWCEWIQSNEKDTG